MASRGRFGMVRAASFAAMMASTMVGGTPAHGQGPGAARLTGWAGEGVLIQGRGMGEDYFGLVAEVEWAKDAPRDPELYRIRLAFPDGRVSTRAFPVDDPPGRKRFAVYVPAAPLRNQVPGAVEVRVTVVDATSGVPASNPLDARIEQFPRPKGDASADDPGPFGWGAPLKGESRLLPNAGPDGLRFARIPGEGGEPGFFIATAEATVAQVGQRLKDYDPKAGRSDEFALEGPRQPAVDLKPAQAMDYLAGLAQADGSGVLYRLPTVAEWTRAAKGGKTSAFWWGDEPTSVSGANLLGPEPTLPVDATAPALPRASSPDFSANPFGLYHTFGNVEEWASDPSGGFARMGGHFRTEPASPLPVVKVEKADELGPDPFVGVRPAFVVSAEEGATLIKRKLAQDPGLTSVAVAYDPETATATLTGPVATPSSRREADRLLGDIVFVAAVDDQLQTPSLAPNQVASLGAPLGYARRGGALDRTFVEVSLPVRWLEPMPVFGTEWWVNIYLPNGGHLANKIDPAVPGRASKILVQVDRSSLAALGLKDDSTFGVALSIGGPSSAPTGPQVVSNEVSIRPVFAPAPRIR